MESVIEKIARFEDPTSWKGQCVIKVKEALGQNTTTTTAGILTGFVNRIGNVLRDPLATPELVAGINYQTCERYCGYDKLATVFSFQVFSSGATNYLLPWLALTAQLPFQTGENEILGNIMSFCYAVGSPMLITYSLATTILNQHWLRQKFLKLESSDRPLHLTSKNVRIFLQESQQLPLRLSQEDGSLASLIVLPENADWWEKLKINILLTRRGVTLALVAQIIVAVLSWVLTVISAFISSLGNAAEALALSSGSLWVWLVPIIYGWIAVGTQRDYGTITRALRRDMANIVDRRPTSQNSPSPDPFRESRFRRDTLSDGFVDAPAVVVSVANEEHELRPRSKSGGTVRRPGPLQGSTVQLAAERQKAFKVAHDRKLMQPLIRTPSLYGLFQLEPSSNELCIPNCLGFSVAGDEKQEGPAFNYARAFTWWNMANRLHKALETTDENLSRRLDLSLKPVPRDMKFKQRDLKGDVLAVSRYCGLAHDTGNLGLGGSPAIEPERISEYPRWDQLDSAFYQRMIIAVLIALYVQWGITASAIIIAYLTEVKGLGCRSGGYILYGVQASLAWLFLFLSSIFSHAAMLRHENSQVCRVDNLYERGDKSARDQLEERSIRSGRSNAGRPSETTPFPQRKYVFSHRTLRFCAVMTRLVGRVLAVTNTIWVLLSSLWELVGFYNNCWCDSTWLSKGAKGWVLLFVEASETADAAAAPWAGGVFLSVFVAGTACAMFWLYCRGNRA
ncbi:hypothetical protein F5Y17DRAFT_476227 [Xylariaceae sp. FL0594]|nr:hypothetical protein F5Y17DRAFT_476227 [Xylariaceae sp. FL0594]